MESPSPNGHRAERDGCGCPPWVKMCAHWEEQRVWLGDEHAGLRFHGQATDGIPHYYVAGPTDDIGPVEGCDHDHVSMSAKHTRTDDLPAAEAEFYERERQLLEAVDA